MISEERHNKIVEAYQDALLPLLLFKPEELEEHHKELKEQHERYLGIAPILYPADYFTKRDSGELDSIEIQNEVAYHLIQARKSIQKLGPGGVLGLAKKVMIRQAERGNPYDDTED